MDRQWQCLACAGQSDCTENASARKLDSPFCVRAGSVQTSFFLLLLLELVCVMHGWSSLNSCFMAARKHHTLKFKEHIAGCWTAKYDDQLQFVPFGRLPAVLVRVRWSPFYKQDNREPIGNRVKNQFSTAASSPQVFQRIIEDYNIHRWPV